MAMVEMVFVLPLLILLVFAIAQFGLMFSRWLTLSNAVREGARVGVTFRGTQAQCNAATPPVTTQVGNAVRSYAAAGGLNLINPLVQVNVSGACGPPGTPLTVDVTYQFRINIPFARLGTGGNNQIPLTYSSTMRNEG